MAIKARIWWDNNAQAYVVSVSYNESFVNALKQLIPSGDRDFDPSTKFWYVKEAYGDFIRKLASDSFGISQVSFTSKTVTQQSQQAGYSRSGASGAMLNPTSGGTTEDAIVAFFGIVPFEAAKKCYLIAAQQFHPDHNPQDGDKMMKLNQLWDRIQKEFFKR